jgi:transketolase N-terminal domain/subunit
MTDYELQLKSFALRRAMLNLIVGAGAGHTGGGLSCLDILNVLYNRVLNVSPQTFTSPTRDRYVQSKGHCVEALYAVLADRGFFPASDLDTVCHYQSHYVGHPTRHIPGIEMNTGALGHGLPICVGMALAGKMDNAPYRVFTLLGDGNGRRLFWEAALAPLRSSTTLSHSKSHPPDHRPHARRDEQRASGRKIPRVRLVGAHRQQPRYAALESADRSTGDRQNDVRHY